MGEDEKYLANLKFEDLWSAATRFGTRALEKTGVDQPTVLIVSTQVRWALMGDVNQARGLVANMGLHRVLEDLCVGE